MTDALRLSAVTGAADILAAVSQWAWYADHAGESCPAEYIATPAAIAARLPWRMPAEDERQGEALRAAVQQAAAHRETADGADSPPVWADAGAFDAAWLAMFLPDEPEAVLHAILARADSPFMSVRLETLHRWWLAIPADGRPDHPAVALVRDWQASRQPGIEPELRKDRRLLPVMPAQPRDSDPARLLGMQLAGLLDGRSPDAGETQLALFTAPKRHRVPLLSLMDASGRPVMAKGRGAPLPSRLFVNAVLAVPVSERRELATRVEITVRQLRNMIWPNGVKDWRTKEWPALKAALLEARDYILPLPDGSPYGRGWYMIALRNVLDELEDRRGLPDLDGRVCLDVAFPPGSHAGPPVDMPELEALSVTSSPRWRAYIAALSLAWKPGRTRRPFGRGGLHAWSRNPADYPVLSREDRRLLAFGEGDTMHRTKAGIDAPWQDLPGLVTLTRQLDPATGEIGFRIVPAEAIREEDGEGENG